MESLIYINILGYLLAGIMGLTLGVIGAGGSILTLPILVYFFHVDALAATSYSLLIVGFTALLGAVKYAKDSQIDYAKGLKFGAPSILAVYLTRAYLMPILPEIIFYSDIIVITKDLFILLLFSFLMMLAAFMMIKDISNISAKINSHRLNGLGQWLILIDGSIIGFLTGILGAGGGFLIIPALVILSGIEMKMAIGTSLFIIACKSLVGFIGDLQADMMLDYSLISNFLLATITGMLLGTLIAKKVNSSSLKKTFGYFTFITGFVIIIMELA